MPILHLLPPELTVYIIGVLPIVDRSAIPIGITTLEMPLWSASLFFFLGNLTASILIYYGLHAIADWLRKHSKWMDRCMTWLFERTQSKHSKRMSELGHIALLLFVAVPIPGSGAWSGALVAYVFGVKGRIALPIIATGLIIATTLIALGAGGIVHLAESL
jgi:uncharacterized membrane protein